MYKEIVLEELLQLQDLNYKKFSNNILPGINNIIGVRIPNLRKITKEINKSFWQEYLTEVLAQTDTYHEETIIQGLIIATAKMPLEKRLLLIHNFVPKISNWAQCDIFCSSLKETKKYPEKYWTLSKNYCFSSSAYSTRFGIVIMLTYYTSDKYAPEVLKILQSIHYDDYYVKMAIAWAISIFYIKQPTLTLPIILDNNFDTFTHNKTIQKICDSYRVSQANKTYLKTKKK